MGMNGTPKMEDPDTTVSAPALVSARLVLNFSKAAQVYGDAMGMHDEVAKRICLLRAGLDNLRDLASLCRFAIVGESRAFARVRDELHCLAVDFRAAGLDPLPVVDEPHEDEPDDGVVLGAAVDLFAGASFVSKDCPEQRDRFVAAIVRAIEEAIAFPVVFAAEAAACLAQGDGTMVPLQAGLVIASATRRLLGGERACAPRAPAGIRRRLHCLARMWMENNPVDSFFAAISGPIVRHVVHWEDPGRDRPDDARVGDPVIVLVEPAGDACECRDLLEDCAVMFCPHAPAVVERVVRGGLQVRVPAGSQTGPIAVLKKSPDFASGQALIGRYAACFPVEWSTSIFAIARMDVWAFATAFPPPVIEILRETQQKTPAQPRSAAFMSVTAAATGGPQ
ncbi:MAG TPA: hypothetical protein PLK99_01870 [Burkholderiales bacterium]|nr:hypothetical protein [Burkholderiales bacterium]